MFKCSIYGSSTSVILFRNSLLTFVVSLARDDRKRVSLRGMSEANDEAISTEGR